MDKEKDKFIVLDDLPRKIGFGANQNKSIIDWINSVGYIIHFKYYDIEGSFEILDYTSKEEKLNIKYNGTAYWMRLSSIRNCEFARLVGKINTGFAYYIGQAIVDDKRNIVITDRSKIRDKNGALLRVYKYKCYDCGFDCGRHYSSKDKEYKEDYWIRESGLNSMNSCACCTANPRIVVEHINSIVATNPELIQYFQGGYDEAKLYTYGSISKIYPVCPDCGVVKNQEMPIRGILSQGIGCTCGDGVKYPNKFGYKLLKLMNVKFIREYSPEWCRYIHKNKVKRGFYDFYFELSDKKYILEMDGGLGHGNESDKSDLSAEESKFIDEKKDRLAKEHGIEVIRIDCDYGNVADRFTYIKNNIINNQKLNKLFDFSTINWIEVGEYALSNLIKMACEIKNNNPNYTTQDVGDVMGFCSSTIRRWLIDGSEVGWCIYDSEQERENIKLKLDKINCKPVEIFKDGVLLGSFKSGRDLEKQSEELFGIKLLSANISKVCTNKKTNYKGFYFRYIDKNSIEINT
jgi:hypothetical protein